MLKENMLKSMREKDHKSELFAKTIIFYKTFKVRNCGGIDLYVFIKTSDGCIYKMDNQSINFEYISNIDYNDLIIRLERNQKLTRVT